MQGICFALTSKPPGHFWWEMLLVKCPHLLLPFPQGDNCHCLPQRLLQFSNAQSCSIWNQYELDLWPHCFPFQHMQSFVKNSGLLQGKVQAWMRPEHYLAPPHLRIVTEKNHDPTHTLVLVPKTEPALPLYSLRIKVSMQKELFNSSLKCPQSGVERNHCLNIGKWGKNSVCVFFVSLSYLKYRFPPPTVVLPTTSLSTHA